MQFACQSVSTGVNPVTQILTDTPLSLPSFPRNELESKSLSLDLQVVLPGKTSHSGNEDPKAESALPLKVRLGKPAHSYKLHLPNELMQTNNCRKRLHPQGRLAFSA
ncbi:hypothetical protein AVEN_130504-1 [Araneus ventricosus]|uniref:Uncharacterized protein n=1 Tax=Araneus ventricosus TaxID=182803 RepID=A0A4Y2ELB1_ARAVE|nr:hypothetical protein AVEN_130504-1 [Araneus ventricosus]